MATESQGSGKSSQGLELAESIKKIAAQNARASLTDDTQLLLYMRSWWSKTYNRPLKDPLLEMYTLEDLLYEFYDKVERNLAEQERMKGQEIAEEELKEKDVLDWAEREEQKELEAIAVSTKKAPESTPPITDPTKDPANIKWMEEQMRLAKAELGDDFGNDLELNFDDK
jgi:hypothetical protein